MAKKTIPKELWIQTPVVLRATAGLRMLTPEKAKVLLDEVRIPPFLTSLLSFSDKLVDTPTIPKRNKPHCVQDREKERQEASEKTNQCSAKAAVLRLSGASGN